MNAFKLAGPSADLSVQALEARQAAIAACAAGEPASFANREEYDAWIAANPSCPHPSLAKIGAAEVNAEANQCAEPETFSSREDYDHWVASNPACPAPDASKVGQVAPDDKEEEEDTPLWRNPWVIAGGLSVLVAGIAIAFSMSGPKKPKDQSMSDYIKEQKRKERADWQGAEEHSRRPMPEGFRVRKEA